ncbi:MAG: DsbA family protein [Candidatus Binatia bacterium]
MDDYLSLPGSYQFVRREPEGATSTRVVMTVFEDFLCPACYRTVTEMLPPLQEKYKERLEVRYVAYPLVHEESRLPARVYVIAQNMGLGKEMQAALFRASFEEQLDTASRGGLARVADSIGLDPEELFSRLDKGEGNSEVDSNLALGQSYRIEAVPGIVFDGWIMAKDITPDNLEKIIAGLLERKRETTPKGKKPVSRK